MPVQIQSLKSGQTIRAEGVWADCWKKGDEFIVQGDGWEARIACHDHEGGPEHGLDGTATEEGELPFELVEEMK